MNKQLKMLWPMLKYPEEISIPDGYFVRTFQKGDENGYIKLLNNNKELGEWNYEKLRKNILDNSLSPEGIHFVMFKEEIVATACSIDRGIIDSKKIAELGWVGSHPNHRNKGLGYIVCAKVLRHLLMKNYDEIFLLTDPWRLAAIKTYLKLGFQPVINEDEVKNIWNNLLEKFDLITYET